MQMRIENIAKKIFFYHRNFHNDQYCEYATDPDFLQKRKSPQTALWQYIKIETVLKGHNFILQFFSIQLYKFLSINT